MAAALGISLTSALLVAGGATGANLGQLQSQLNWTQAQLNASQAKQETLSGSISVLNSQVASLGDQITLVRSREAAAQAQLARYDATLATAKGELSAERLRLTVLKARLRLARKTLAAELVSQYEQPQQSLISVVIEAKGFNQLLSQLQYLSDAKKQEQATIELTQSARAQAIVAARRIGKLEAIDQADASDAATQTNALSGMNMLLASQETALSDERAAQSTALADEQVKGAQLENAVEQIQQQEQVAQQATQTFSGGGGGLGASAGWAIPYPIVLCESGGQNLPPNAAGASGYYQIIPSTWKLFGGVGPAAYLEPKAEQDAVAARIWDGGAGASNWACSAIVGIT